MIASDKRALCQREIDVVKLVAEGLQNKEIAHRLGLTEGTVKTYLNHAFHKLGFHNRTEVAAWIIRGLG